MLQSKVVGERFQFMPKLPDFFHMIYLLKRKIHFPVNLGGYLQEKETKAEKYRLILVGGFSLLPPKS